MIAHPGPPSYGTEPSQPDLRGLAPALRQVTGALLYFLELSQPGARAQYGAIAGVPGSPGLHTGPARVIHGESEFVTAGPGDVLICPITSPAWSLLFAQAGAVVTDGGGILAHAAVIAREYAIPAVLATGNATSRLRDGEIVTVDGTAGRCKSTDTHLPRGGTVTLLLPMQGACQGPVSFALPLRARLSHKGSLREGPLPTFDGARAA